MEKNKIAGVRSVYTFDQLEEGSQEKARDWYREGNDYPMLWGDLMNLTKEALEEAGFRVGEMDQKFDIFYSLSNCQGDGFSFSGDLERKGKSYTITQSGNYFHEMTMIAVEVSEEGEEEYVPEVLEECREIARRMERAGYDDIEYQNSDEYVDESIEDNEYTFTKEGERMDADQEETNN